MSKKREAKVEAVAVSASAAAVAAPEAANKAEPMAEATVAAKGGPRVYCGPTVRGVVKQYTVFAGDIPAALNDFIEQHPAAKALLVPVERFAQTRKQMETAGTAEAILYHKIKSEL